MLGRLTMIVLAGAALTACQPQKADNDNGQDISVPAPREYSAAEKTTIQATFPVPYNTADLADGEKQFNKCRACHTISPEKMDLTGPHLYGLFGRKSGTVAGYTFSDAMKAHDTVWDFDTLDTYISAPQATVKGTKMPYQGLKDDTQRHDLIAYLKMETEPHDATVSASSAP